MHTKMKAGAGGGKGRLEKAAMARKSKSSRTGYMKGGMVKAKAKAKAKPKGYCRGGMAKKGRK